MAETVENTYKSLAPTRKERVHSILARLGHDLSDWNNIKGVAAKAPANPKYCYNWSFEHPSKAVAVCIWYAEISYDEDSIFQANNLRGGSTGQSIVSRSIWKRRARAVDRDIKLAYLNRLPINA